MTGYLILVLISLLWAVDFAINKIYQKHAGTSLRAGVGFNALLGLLTALIFFAANGFTAKIYPFSLLMAAFMALFVMGYNLLGFRILKNGGMALYTVFLMTGGMVVPYIWGLIFLNESFSVLRTLGLLCIIASVIISNANAVKISRRQTAMCFAVFFLNGFSSVTSKIHQTETALDTVDTLEFVMWVGVFKFIIAGAVYLFTHVKSKSPSDVPAREPANAYAERKVCNRAKLLSVIVASVTASSVAYALQLFCAKSISAGVLFPFTSGASIVFSTLIGAVFFKEKLSKRLIFGVCLCTVGVLLFF